MQRIFITGANRGIGLELVRQYLEQDTARLFATARQPASADALTALAAQYPDRLTIIRLEVTDAEAIEAAVRTVRAEADGLDALLNNAAINPPRPSQLLDNITPETMLEVLRVNVAAPLMIARAFAPLLQAGDNPRLVNFSSGLGSLERRTYGGLYAYSTSKAALNSVTRGLAVDLRPQGITVIALHPGWVQTDMGGENAALTPQEAVAGVRQVIAGLTAADNGRFYQWNGEIVAW